VKSFVSLYSSEIGKLQIINYKVSRKMISLKKDNRSGWFRTVCQNVYILQFTQITLYCYKLKSKCVIHNYVWLHLFCRYTIKLHVIAAPSYTDRVNNQPFSIDCLLRKGFTNSPAIYNVQHLGLKHLYSPFPWCMILWCYEFIKSKCHHHTNYICNAVCLYCGFYEHFDTEE